jgi:tetratricopeptide (TPR) repeat protein
MLYRERALRDPGDLQALEGMAALQVQRGAYAAAIASYRRILQIAPHNHDAKVGLGRALAFSAQYEAAIRNFQELLQQVPGDTDALDGLARAEAWAGSSEASLPIFRSLAAEYPTNPDYVLGLARVEMNLRRYASARETLTAFLADHPGDRNGQLQLAYLDLYEGHQAEALRRFNRLISQDPGDVEALKGNVRVAYYRGDLVYARNLAAKLVGDNPRDADAVLLLARIQRALHNPRQAYDLLHRTESFAPHSPEAGELENSLRQDSRPSMHTSLAFARETGTANSANTEDLTMMGYEEAWSFAAFPKSDSHLSLAYLPSESPTGGVRGAVGPSQIAYSQTIYVLPQLTVRGGLGLTRFGPGVLAGIPTQGPPIISAGIRPQGLVSASYALDKRLTFDFTAARTAVTYTPTAVRLGVMENRAALGLAYRFNSRTDAQLQPFATDDSTIAYDHASSLAGSASTLFHAVDHNRAAGAAFSFNRQVLREPAIGIDVGYSALAYEMAGGAKRPYLGIFNPGFYQRHYLTAHLTGKLSGPFGYDFSTGAGIQQIERASPLKPALLLNPAFTLKASPRLLLTLGYTHYDSSPSLGTLRGNAVQLTTDWKF